MSSPLKIMNPLEWQNWNDLVAASEGYSFFHSSNWAKVLCESYGYKPVYLGSIRNDRFSVLVPMMDVRSLLTGRRGVSLPFTDCCEPVIGEYGGFRDAMDFLAEYGKNARWNHIEFRGGRYFSEEAPCARYYLGHILHLSGNEETVFSGLRDSTGRNIKKALNMGVRVEISTTRDALVEFFRLHCITRKMHGLPPQPSRFFKNIYEHVIARECGMIALASYGGRFIAGAVYFHLGEKAYYKYSASDRRYQETRPNNLIMWEAIRWYLERGCKVLSLGRTECNAAGLRQYKRGWGAEEHTIKYHKYIPGKDVFIGSCSPVKEQYYTIFRYMPMLLSKFAGTLLYKHIG